MPVKPSRRRARKSRTPESGVLAEVLQCLAHHRILAFRVQTGAHVAEYKGKKRLIRYGHVGMSDVLAFPKVTKYDEMGMPIEFIVPCWIEAKAKSGTQTPHQNLFQQVVESSGHWYLVCRSYEELESFLRSKGVIR